MGQVGVERGFGIGVEAQTAVGARTGAAVEFESVEVHIVAAARTEERRFAVVGVQQRNNCQCLSTWFAGEFRQEASMGMAAQWQPIGEGADGRSRHRGLRWRRPVGGEPGFGNQADDWYCTFAQGMPSQRYLCFEVGSERVRGLYNR